MRMENELQHINGKEIDYVLGLLPGHERLAVEQHIAECNKCRIAINKEKLVGVEVKRTLTQAGTVNESRLRMRQPLFTKSNLFQQFVYRGQRQLLIAGFMVFLVIASVGLQLKLQGNSLYATTPAITSTSTLVTDTPTYTAVATAAAGSPVNSTSPTPDVRVMDSLPEAMIAPEASSPSIFATN